MVEVVTGYGMDGDRAGLIPDTSLPRLRIFAPAPARGRKGFPSQKARNTTERLIAVI